MSRVLLGLGHERKGLHLAVPEGRYVEAGMARQNACSKPFRATGGPVLESPTCLAAAALGIAVVLVLLALRAAGTRTHAHTASRSQRIHWTSTAQRIHADINNNPSNPLASCTVAVCIHLGNANSAQVALSSLQLTVKRKAGLSPSFPLATFTSVRKAHHGVFADGAAVFTETHNAGLLWAHWAPPCTD